jgi:two-component system response regulator MprA
VHALLRRATPNSKPEIVRYADLTLDTGTRLAKRANRQFELTAKEYDLLEYFMRNPRQVLTREQILDRVWGYDFGGESNVLEVYIRYLRQKTEAEAEQRLIHTVRSVGYVLREE